LYLKPDESKGENVISEAGGSNLALPTNSLSPPAGRGLGRGDLNLKIIGLLTPPLSSFWEEREKNGSSVKIRQRQGRPLGGGTSAGRASPGFAGGYAEASRASLPSRGLTYIIRIPEFLVSAYIAVPSNIGTV